MGEFLARLTAGAVVVASTAVVLGTAGPAEAAASCTIVGTPGDDRLTGTLGRDVICGLGGRDTLRGRGGDDELWGGDGDDILYPGGGSDLVAGQVGTDQVRYDDRAVPVAVALGGGWAHDLPGETEPDVLTGLENAVGSSADDRLFGSDARNVLTGLGGNDIFDGWASADAIFPGLGDDSVDGGAGSDTVRFDDVTTAGVDVVLNGPNETTATGHGTDRLVNLERATGTELADRLAGAASGVVLTGRGGDDDLIGGRGLDTLDGGAGNDLLRGSLSADQLLGGDGDDELHPGRGNDNVQGGIGADMVSYSDEQTSNGIDISLGLGAAGAFRPELGHDTLFGVENATGTPQGDLINGDDLGNDLDGVGGTDEIHGLGGDDYLLGGDGWNDSIWPGLGDDQAYGGPDADTLRYDEAEVTAGVTIDMNAGWSNTVAAGTDVYVGFESLVGTDHDDTLVGDTGGNWIDGLGGTDRIWGLDGNDTLWGRDGWNDSIWPGPGNDHADGGGDADTIRYDEAGVTGGVNVSLSTNRVTGAAGDDTLANFESVVGTELDDVIDGDDNDNWLDGLGGNDRIYGYFRDDTLLGGPGDDLLAPGWGDDTADGGLGTYDTVDYGPVNQPLVIRLDQGSASGAGADRLDQLENAIGGAGNDEIWGTNDPNELQGAGGNDWIYGLYGDDRLWGERVDDSSTGAGADQILPGPGNDRAHGGGGSNNTISYIDITQAGWGMVIPLNGTTSELCEPNRFCLASTHGGGVDTLTNFANAEGTNFADLIRVGRQGYASIIYGRGGDDELHAFDNDDLDQVWGDGGYDTCDWDNALTWSDDGDCEDEPGINNS